LFGGIGKNPRRSCIVVPDGIKKYGKIIYEENKGKNATKG